MPFLIALLSFVLQSAPYVAVGVGVAKAVEYGTKAHLNEEQAQKVKEEREREKARFEREMK